MLIERRSPEGDRWWLVAAAGVALFIGQLDSTIVNVALPTLEDEFATSTEVTQWVVLGCALPLIGFALPAGRWVDTVGLRAALTFAVTGFAIASALVGLAPDMAFLIVARVAQGTFGAIMFTLVPVLATVAVSPRAKGRAMAVVMTLGPLGAVSGPALGGIAIDTIGWRWVFFANLPVAVVVVAIGYAQLDAGARLRWPDRATVAQVALLVGAAASVLVALTFGVRQPAWLLLAGLAVPLVIIWLRLDASRPVVELLATPGLRGIHMSLLLEMSAVAAMSFLIPFHLVRDVGSSAAEAGLVMLAMPAVMILAGGPAGAAVDRSDARRVAHRGAWVVTTASAMIVGGAAFGGSLAIAGALALLGLGAAYFAGPSQAAAMDASDAGRLGTTAATTSLARQLGAAAGPAIATTVWTVAGGDETGLLTALAVTVPICLLSAGALGARRPLFEPAEGVVGRRAAR